MYRRLFRIVSLCFVRYRRVIFGLCLATFVALYLFESCWKPHWSATRLAKHRAWRSVKSSLKDVQSGVKSSLSDIKSAVADFMQRTPEEEVHRIEADHRSTHDLLLQSSKNEHIVVDPLQPKTDSIAEPAPEPEILWNIYEEKPQQDVPKHWLPSYGQKRALSGRHAKYPLDFEDEDVLVFMHIPKTSGKTFNSHLVIDMNVPKQIQCACKTTDKPHGCKCLNSEGYIWLFSRLTTAWPCGVHPSWSDLSRDCLNHALDRKEKKTRKRRFTLVTMLRSPYTRYISEWHNVQQDGQWRPFQNLRCYPLTREAYCYDDDWRGVTLDQFLDCPSNPANNRQVRMLADLHMANCSQIFDWLKMPEQNDDVQDANRRYQYIVNNPLLRSAIHNLKRLPFFGLEEYQRESEYLFIRTFGYTFKRHFRQAKTFSEQVVVTDEQRQRIFDLNRLDLVLYRYAKELFFKRLHENVKRKHVFFTDNIDFTTQDAPETTTSRSS